MGVDGGGTGDMSPSPFEYQREGTSPRNFDIPVSCFLYTRTGKGGGAGSALPSCFLVISFEVFVRSP